MVTFVKNGNYTVFDHCEGCTGILPFNWLRAGSGFAGPRILHAEKFCQGGKDLEARDIL